MNDEHRKIVYALEKVTKRFSLALARKRPRDELIVLLEQAIPIMEQLRVFEPDAVAALETMNRAVAKLQSGGTVKEAFRWDRSFRPEHN